jgi:hypothetical protein
MAAPTLGDVLAAVISTRTELMARMDRLQTRMDSINEHLLLGLGHTDRVERKLTAVSDDNRLLSEMSLVLERMVLHGRRRAAVAHDGPIAVRLDIECQVAQTG